MAVAVLLCAYLDLGVDEAVVQLVGGLAVPEYVAEGLKHKRFICYYTHYVLYRTSFAQSL